MQNGKERNHISDSLEVLVRDASASVGMRNSPVRFFADLLSAYASGELSLKELASRLNRENREAQFYYSHMPKEEIQRNKELFTKEFRFADAVIDLLMELRCHRRIRSALTAGSGRS